MKKMIKSIAVILLVCAVLCFSACIGKKTQAINIAETYIEKIREMDFDGAYKYVCRRCNNISLENYIDAWDKIINVLHVTNIEVDDGIIETEGDEQYLCYTIRFISERVDTIETQVRAKLTYYDGEAHVDFDYSQIMEGYSSDVKVRERPLKGVRGEIFAEDGTLIASNSYSDTVYIKVSKELDISKTLSELSAVIDGLNVEKLRKSYDSAIENDYAQVVVKSYNRGTMDEALQDRIKEIDGVDIDNSSLTYQRYYPYGELFSNVTGYVGEPTEAQTEKYPYSKKTLIIGKAGLESAWEDILHAEDGYSIELVNETGTVLKVLKRVPAVDGCDIRTSLRVSDQTRAFYALEKYLLDSQTGCAIVMNTKTAEISAMASNPYYDANVFAYPISDETYESLFGEESNQPLLNRATQVTLAPGSTIKPFTAAAALDSGTLSMESVFPYEIEDNKWQPNDPNWIWPPISRSRSTPGELNMYSAIRSSDNIYFGWAAMKMGEEVFLKYLREKLHFDEEFSFDLPVKKANVIGKDTELTPKLLSDMGFGVGEMLVSPVQLISYYTCFENDGEVLKPRIVSSLTKSDGIYEETQHEFVRTVLYDSVMSDSSREKIYKALLEVVNTGTAHSIHDRKRTVAAKTGTAVVSNKREISWIVAFFTEMDEDRIILVMIDGPSDMGDNKFDIANVLLEVRNPTV